MQKSSWFQSWVDQDVARDWYSLPCVYDTCQLKRPASLHWDTSGYWIDRVNVCDDGTETHGEVRTGLTINFKELVSFRPSIRSRGATSQLELRFARDQPMRVETMIGLYHNKIWFHRYNKLVLLPEM